MRTECLKVWYYYNTELCTLHIMFTDFAQLFFLVYNVYVFLYPTLLNISVCIYTVVWKRTFSVNLLQTCEKLSVTYHSGTCRTIFSSSNIVILSEESFLIYNLQCLKLEGLCLCTGFLSPVHKHSVSCIYFFKHSVVDLLLWSGSLSCFQTQLQPSFTCWAEFLTLVYRGVYGMVLSLKTVCLDIWSSVQSSLYLFRSLVLLLSGNICYAPKASYLLDLINWSETNKVKLLWS